MLQRHGDHHPLTHATAELMRILRETALWVWNADGGQEIYCLLAGCSGGMPRWISKGSVSWRPIDRTGLRRSWFLEDHGDLASPNVAHRLLGTRRGDPSLKQDLATNDAVLPEPTPSA